MDCTLAGLQPAFGYLDDVLVSSPGATPDQHIRDLDDVFKRLRTASLVVNDKKCVFAVQELDFLGQHMSAAGISPLPNRVKALRSHPRPNTVWGG